LNVTEGISNLNLICNSIGFNSILFNVKHNDLDIRIIYIKENTVLLIAIREKNAAWFIPVREDCIIDTYIPTDMFLKIMGSLDYRKDDKNKKTTYYFFSSINKSMNTLAKNQVEKVNNISKDELDSILKATKTTDTKYDKDNGNKPYFDTWVRNNYRNVSEDNLRKTRRVFGEKVAKFCRDENISSRWSSKPTESSSEIFYSSKIEEGIGFP